MIRTTPFHERLTELNDQHLYTHWSGFLSALRYTHAPKHEYFAVRNGVGIFDTSPLFKYRITGPDATDFLGGVVVRDLSALRPGRAAYTSWCDDRGFVMEDGVAFRLSVGEVLLTSARPALSWLTTHRHGRRVLLEDVTDEYAMLAVQGPRSRDVLAGLVPEVTALPYFGLAEAKLASVPVVVSRTGYTGDLGFELMVRADDALTVLDAVLDAGRPHGLRPFGEEAIDMLRIEAGLPLVDVEWHNSRTAWTDHERVTPRELGLGWMLKGVRDRTRRFVGSEAIRRELIDDTSRWATTGIVVDWADWDRLHRDAGLLPTKDEKPLGWELWLRNDDDEQVGYVTSFLYSPGLQRHVGLARVRPPLAVAGTGLHMETTLQHHTTMVGVTTAPLPFFNPSRKTATP
ncbi:MAG: aminomethyltransferase family protein [Nocardioides sp.]